jgi:predicted nucleic acid-binding protein
MELVVDTNILLAGLLKPSTTQRLLFSEKLRLFAPEHSLKEIEKHSNEFAKRMGKTKNEFEVALSLIS